MINWASEKMSCKSKFNYIKLTAILFSIFLMSACTINKSSQNLNQNTTSDHASSQTETALKSNNIVNEKPEINNSQNNLKNNDENNQKIEENNSKETAQFANDIGEAIISPLRDFNLVQAEIPLVLKIAQRNPYAEPVERTCAEFSNEIRHLDAVLGADFDTPSNKYNRSIIDQGAHEVSREMIRSVRSTTEGLIPFRGWVRRLTGAERYSRKVIQAIAAGTVRRAYLKGLGESLCCAVPAAPRPLLDDANSEENSPIYNNPSNSIGNSPS